MIIGIVKISQFYSCDVREEEKESVFEVIISSSSLSITPNYSLAGAVSDKIYFIYGHCNTQHSNV